MKSLAWTYRGRDGGCNIEMQEETAYYLREPTGGGSQPNILVLNDQGGGIMNVSDKPGTLRAQMKHHEPVVCYCAAFMGGQGAKARSIAYCDDGTTPTLKSAPSGGNTVPDVVYEVKRE